MGSFGQGRKASPTKNQGRCHPATALVLWTETYMQMEEGVISARRWGSWGSSGSCGSSSTGGRRWGSTCRRRACTCRTSCLRPRGTAYRWTWRRTSSPCPGAFPGFPAWGRAAACHGTDSPWWAILRQTKKAVTFWDTFFPLSLPFLGEIRYLYTIEICPGLFALGGRHERCGILLP